MKQSLNNINLKNLIMRDKHDFDIGYLKQSPCMECKKYDSLFPKCFISCKTLDEVQKVLAAGVSCYNNTSL